MLTVVSTLTVLAVFQPSISSYSSDLWYVGTCKYGVLFKTRFLNIKQIK